MPALRASTLLARLVLAWFVVALAVAGLAPLASAQATELICTGEGMQRVPLDRDALPEAPGHVLDCALCLPAGAPPPQAMARQALPLPLPALLQPIPAARLAALVGAPLPARGPPARA